VKAFSATNRLIFIEQSLCLVHTRQGSSNAPQLELWDILLEVVYYASGTAMGSGLGKVSSAAGYILKFFISLSALRFVHTRSVNEDKTPLLNHRLKFRSRTFWGTTKRLTSTAWP